jgi:hypothetical protein
MFKKDKYHNCFKPFVQTTQKLPNKKKQKNKPESESHNKLQNIIEMLECLGWEKKNIEVLRNSWFDLED